MAIVVDKGRPLDPVDQKLSSANRTAATTAAVMALTPGYAGEIVRALDSGIEFMGTALSAGAWKTCDPEQRSG